MARFCNLMVGGKMIAINVDHVIEVQVGLDDVTRIRVTGDWVAAVVGSFDEVVAQLNGVAPQTPKNNAADK
jgi:hypothetical protein